MAIKNLEELDKISQEYANTFHNIARATAKYEEYIAKKRAEFNESVAALQSHLDEMEGTIINFAEAKKDIVFTDKKSYKNAHVTIKLHKSALSLKIKKGLKEIDVMEKIKTAYSYAYDRWVSAKPRLDKTKLKDSIKSGELNIEKLADIGLVTEENETIKIMPNN